MKVQSIMLCERIQEEIKKENWQMARTWTNMLSAIISQHEQPDAKSEGNYETVPVDNEQGSA
jgi:hypothetical protein